MNYVSELEQEPFDAVEFVERLAWRATTGKFEGESFDANVLQEAFQTRIDELKGLHETHQKKCERLEMVLKEEEKRHRIRVNELQIRSREAQADFNSLDSRLDAVAAKVVYLGDQLESVNIPRSRAVEAHRLIRRFAEFHLPKEPKVSTLSPERLFEEADVIHKLYQVCQELPPGRFDEAKNRVNLQYDAVEKELIEEFANSMVGEPDRERMREIAQILSHFKGYNQVIDAFIEQSQAGVYLTPSLFNEVLPICQKSQALVRQVFQGHDQQDKVMSKFILNLFHGKIQEYVMNKLTEEKSDPEKYLNTLQDLYSKTVKLSENLAEAKIQGASPSFLNTCTRAVFARWLDHPNEDSYFNTEQRSLEEKCQTILKRFYDARNHVKRPLQTGSIQELKRDLQAKIGRANINIANLNITVSGNEGFSGDTLISEEVAINILQETKLALNRCTLLSKPQSLPASAACLLKIQLKNLAEQHLEYALDLALNALSPPEPRNQPDLFYFEVVRQCNAVCHLMEKQFVESVLPVVSSTSSHAECLRLKKEAFEKLEHKLNLGLEKTINSALGWSRVILTREQKKNEFVLETDDVNIIQTTVACSKTVRFISTVVKQISDSLDGKNVEAVLKELGTRFHRLVYEHLLQHQVNSNGAMIVICDVNEYRKTARQFNLPLIDKLFDMLHDLCNLLVVQPENIRQVSVEGRLADLDKSVINSFIQLRADYKSARLAKIS